MRRSNYKAEQLCTWFAYMQYMPATHQLFRPTIFNLINVAFSEIMHVYKTQVFAQMTFIQFLLTNDSLRRVCAELKIDWTNSTNTHTFRDSWVVSFFLSMNSTSWRGRNQSSHVEFRSHVLTVFSSSAFTTAHRKFLWTARHERCSTKRHTHTHNIWHSLHQCTSAILNASWNINDGALHSRLLFVVATAVVAATALDVCFV